MFRRTLVLFIAGVMAVWGGAAWSHNTYSADLIAGLELWRFAVQPEPFSVGNAPARPVPNLVDLATGGLGPVIQDPLNSSQTPTLARFNTLAALLSACIKAADHCAQLFQVATPPRAAAPDNTLAAAHNIARNPTHRAQELFALLDIFYPVPTGKR